MITTKSLVPEIYYNDSRDFQFIGRLFEVAFSHVKTNADMILNNPFSKNIDVRLLDLVAKTVGFETKHKYNVNDLKGICSCFKEIIREKGSKKAVSTLVRCLLKAQNIKSNYQIEVYADRESERQEGEEASLIFQPYSIVIIVPYELKDRVLIEDVLDYILPAGYTYRIISAKIADASEGANEISVYTYESGEEDEWTPYSREEYSSIKANASTGLDMRIASLIPNISEESGGEAEESEGE